MSPFLFEVTDLKQYTYCPRIVFYRYCLPKIRPVTYLMEEGIHAHEQEEEREERRSLHRYGLSTGERAFHLSLQSATLNLTGRIDLAIATPSRNAPEAEGIVVEYKLSEHKAGAHFKLQLAAYALLLEEAWNIPVRQAFLYSIPLRKAEAIPITPSLRKKVLHTVAQIQRMIPAKIRNGVGRGKKAHKSCPVSDCWEKQTVMKERSDQRVASFFSSKTTR